MREIAVGLRLTLFVLKATVLQSGKMLMEYEGNLYVTFWNRTLTSLTPLFTKKAAHSLDLVLNTKACQKRRMSNMRSHDPCICVETTS